LPAYNGIRGRYLNPAFRERIRRLHHHVRS
jgi:hypothetical protein